MKAHFCNLFFSIKIQCLKRWALCKLVVVRNVGKPWLDVSRLRLTNNWIILSVENEQQTSGKHTENWRSRSKAGEQWRWNGGRGRRISGQRTRNRGQGKQGDPQFQQHQQWQWRDVPLEVPLVLTQSFLVIRVKFSNKPLSCPQLFFMRPSHPHGPVCLPRCSSVQHA